MRQATADKTTYGGHKRNGKKTIDSRKRTQRQANRKEKYNIL